MAAGWPAVLVEGDVRLRPLRRRDQDTWMALRAQNAAWLEPWDATSPVPVSGPRPSFGTFVRTLSAQARAGVTLPFAIDHAGRLVGQLTVSSIIYGSLRSAAIGYWVSEHVAGLRHHPDRRGAGHRPLLPDVLGLHRVEINIRPENGPSLRVVREARVPRRGRAGAVPAHPGPLVRPPHVRPDRRGRPRRAAAGTRGRPGAARVDRTRSSGDAQADTPRRSPAGAADRRLPS